MALIQRKTDEQKAQEAAIREQRRRDADARKREEAIERERQAFFKSPAGRARLAYARGDQVFQYSHGVMSQQAIIVAMVGSKTSQKTNDPVTILNSVCHEGWELVNGSFVFVEQGQQSRDKFMSSGQNVAIKGETVGYYLFRRCDTNLRKMGDPWEHALADDDLLECTACGADVTAEATVCPTCGVEFEQGGGEKEGDGAPT